MNRVWILGAPDPEMEMIEKLLRECGESVAHAHARGARVHPGTAYRGEYVEYVTHCGLAGTPGETWYLVECDLPIPDGAEKVVIDHHRPGDPGYGRPPEDFMAASSIGQVLSVLRGHGPAFFDAGEWITCDGGEPRDVGGFVIGMPYADTVPHEMVLAAAADHCLAHAYAGRCPGVDPDDLLAWRIVSRAKFQNRSAREILLDVEAAREALSDAPRIALSEPVADLRHAYTVSTVLVEPFAEGATVDAAGVGDSREVVFGARDEGAWDEGGHHTFVRRGVPELPEAAAHEGVAYLASVTDRDGREKIVLGGLTTPEMVRAFMEQWAPAKGLTGIYGDPERGFAGGYLGGRK